VIRNGEDPTRSFVYRAPGNTPRALVVWEGRSVSRPLVAGARLVIGRGQDSDLHVLHGSVSRHHAALFVGSSIEIEDLGSANGTRVDGVALGAGRRVAIGPSSVVEIGAALVVLQGVHDPAPALGEAAPKAMQRVRELVDRIAPTSLSVILLGETGVGKEVTADAIHKRSTRAAGPFIRLNSAALAESVLESELFGHEKGAFTGATESKRGLIETANGGTLFLDEVGDLPLATQAKLLRALEAREVLPVGARTARPVDVRVISATNRALPELVDACAFRADLYFRLNGITLFLPPLRERVDEILPLASSFAEAMAARLGRRAPSITTARAALEAYGWPGNVRELKNVIERAVVLADDVIGGEHLLFESSAPSRAGAAAPHDAASGKLLEDVGAFERARIVEALERCNGNQTRAAALLGIARRTLVSRLDAHRIPRPRKPS
jgi:transcriptional regulator with PAS, ATPase and Fis domain